jgi:hypothetical protein
MGGALPPFINASSWRDAQEEFIFITKKYIVRTGGGKSWLSIVSNGKPSISGAKVLASATIKLIDYCVS